MCYLFIKFIYLIFLFVFVLIILFKNNIYFIIYF